MLFWHLGATLWLFRWIFRDPKVDVRFLLVGAILPDLVDMTIGTWLAGDRFGRSELWFHSLLLPAIFMLAVVIATRRGRRRRAWMALGIGWMFHLLLDGMWTDQHVFLWPLFGLELAPGDVPFWPAAWDRALSDPWRWLEEAVGLTYLTWLWVQLRLGDRDRMRSVLTTGRLPENVTQA